MQFFLSCGSEVTIYTQLVGYGLGEETTIFPSTPMIQNFEVESWQNDDEDLVSEVFFF